MKGEIQILAVELDGKDRVMVTFSDGTTGGYVVEELLELRPVRERMRIKKKTPNTPKQNRDNPCGQVNMYIKHPD